MKCLEVNDLLLKAMAKKLKNFREKLKWGGMLPYSSVLSKLYATFQGG